MARVRLSKSDEDQLANALWFYRRYPVFAVEDLLGIRLSIHQGLMLKALWGESRSVVQLCGRGVSKSFMLALCGVLRCLLYPNEKILFVGSGFRQSKEMMLEAERIISGSLPSQKKLGYAKASLKKRPGAKSVVDKSPEAWRIEWSTNSYLLAIPLASKGSDDDVGGADTIRGYRANRLYLDEVKDIPRGIIDKILRPTTVVKIDPVGGGDGRENQIVYSGTIDYDVSYFWEVIEMHRAKVREKDKSHQFVSFTYLDTYKDDNGVRVNWNPPYRMEIDQIESMLRDGVMSEEVWLSEYRCVPIRTAGTYYPYNLIMDASNFIVSDNPEHEEFLVPKLTDLKSPVAIGADVARVDDWSSIVVISANAVAGFDWDPRIQAGSASFNHIVYAYQCRNEPYSFFARKLREVRARFPNAIKIAIDARGGDAILDKLAFEFDAGERAWFDPDDESRAGKVNRDTAEPIIKAIKASDVLNNEWNSFVKGQFESGNLRFPKVLSRHKNSEMEDVYHNIEKLMHQFISIRTKLSAKSNMFTFTTQNPKKNKKDLYSATVYGMSVIKDSMYSNKDMNNIKPLCGYA